MISAPKLLNCSTIFGKRLKSGLIALSVLCHGAAKHASNNPYAACMMSLLTRFAGANFVGPCVIMVTGFDMMTSAFIFANSCTKNHPYSYIRLWKIAFQSALSATTASECTKSGGNNGHCSALTSKLVPLIVFDMLSVWFAGIVIVFFSRSSRIVAPNLRYAVIIHCMWSTIASVIVISPSVMRAAAIIPPTSI